MEREGEKLVAADDEKTSRDGRRTLARHATRTRRSRENTKNTAEGEVRKKFDPGMACARRLFYHGMMITVSDCKSL